MYSPTCICICMQFSIKHLILKKVLNIVSIGCLSIHTYAYHSAVFYTWKGTYIVKWDVQSYMHMHIIEHKAQYTCQVTNVENIECVVLPIYTYHSAKSVLYLAGSKHSKYRIIVLHIYAYGSESSFLYLASSIHCKYQTHSPIYIYTYTHKFQT